jgi:hypothetical protein
VRFGSAAVEPFEFACGIPEMPRRYSPRLILLGYKLHIGVFPPFTTGIRADFESPSHSRADPSAFPVTFPRPASIHACRCNRPGKENFMQTLLTSAALLALAASSASVPLAAQMQDNTEKRLACSNNNNDGDRARHCEIREQNLPSIGRLAIDADRNGGVTVKGWLRGDVLVRSRVEASSDTEAAARTLVSQVSIDGSGGQVRALGPAPANDSGWSVSYEIFIPQNSDLSLKTNNGGINISDVHGQIHFDAKNGGVQLKRVMGEVTGATVNGGIQVELTGAAWDGRQMELSTHNGGVTVTMPSHFSARVQAETGMGRISSDFPLPPSTGGRNQHLDFAIGAGGPPIHITTGNGSIQLKRSDSK